MVYVEDNIAWETMVQLAACLCTTLEERGLPSTCQCSVVPGPLAIMDYCGSCGKGTNGEKCGGQAWVRLVTEYPSTSFPTSDTTANNCGSTMAYTLEVGIARCQPTGKANSITGVTPPTMEELVEATRLQMADKAAMRAAIACCLDDDDKDLTYVLTGYTPTGAGDCGGGAWAVTIWSA